MSGRRDRTLLPARSTPRAHVRAQTFADRLRALRSRGADGPGSVRWAGALLLLACAVLVVSQWRLYPPEDPGQANALRALGCAVVLGLVGVRLCTAQPGPTHRVAAALAALAGVALLASALLATHERTGPVVVEVLAAALALVAAAGTVVVEPVRARRTT